jgi:hypothetical protein
MYLTSNLNLKEYKMPTAYIEKLVKEGKGSKAHLEKEWDAAKKNAKDQGRGDDYAYITGIFRKRAGLASVADTLNETPLGDVITLDVPTMIRMLELSRETLKTDEAIHIVVERMVAESKKVKVLTMQEYPTIWSNKDEQEMMNTPDQSEEQEVYSEKPIAALARLKSISAPSKDWKSMRLKGCKCPTPARNNPKCPIHGTNT